MSQCRDAKVLPPAARTRPASTSRRRDALPCGYQIEKSWCALRQLGWQSSHPSWSTRAERRKERSCLAQPGETRLRAERNGRHPPGRDQELSRAIRQIRVDCRVRGNKTHILCNYGSSGLTFRSHSSNVSRTKSEESDRLLASARAVQLHRHSLPQFQSRLLQWLLFYMNRKV